MEVRVREQTENVIVETDDVTGETVLWLRPGVIPTETICELGIALEHCRETRTPLTHYVAVFPQCDREHIAEIPVQCYKSSVVKPHLRANSVPKARQR